VPSALAARVLGKGRAHLKALRAATKTKIVAVDGDSCVHLQVFADTQAQLDAAVAAVARHAGAVAAAEPLTHLIAVPAVADRAFVDAVRRFLDLAGASSPLGRAAFENLARLHVTLLTLRLRAPEEVRRAGAALRAAVAQFDWRAEREAEIAGINTMQGDDGRPRLFYAQLRGTAARALLVALQRALAAALCDAGLDVVDVPDPLHITVARRAWATGGLWAPPALVERAMQFRLPPAPLTEVVLCKRFPGPGQFYEECAAAEIGPAGDGASDRDA
jgi:hypothetical protein